MEQHYRDAEEHAGGVRKGEDGLRHCCGWNRLFRSKPGAQHQLKAWEAPTLLLESRAGSWGPGSLTAPRASGQVEVCETQW